MVASWARMGFGHSEDRDIGCHTAQDHHEAFRYKTGLEFDTSPVGDLSLVGWYSDGTPLVGWCKERYTRFVGRD